MVVANKKTRVCVRVLLSRYAHSCDSGSQQQDRKKTLTQGGVLRHLVLDRDFCSCNRTAKFFFAGVDDQGLHMPGKNINTGERGNIVPSENDSPHRKAKRAPKGRGELHGGINTSIVHVKRQFNKVQKKSIVTKKNPSRGDARMEDQRCTSHSRTCWAVG